MIIILMIPKSILLTLIGQESTSKQDVGLMTMRVKYLGSLTYQPSSPFPEK